MNTKIVLCTIVVALFALTEAHHKKHHKPVHYKFEYGVHDPHTHDHKTHHEHRHGHNVKGGYTLKEADGTFRIVKYVAGHHSGFNAIVKRLGHAQHPGHKKGHKGGTSYVGVTHYGYH